MQSYFKRYARNFDYPLFFMYLFLCLFGLVMIYSASMVWSVNKYGYEPDHFFRKQIFNLIVAAPMFALGAIFPYKHYRKKPLMITMVLVMFIFLAAVHIWGFEAGGAQSWINLGIANFQPSELAKIIIVLYFAGVFTKKSEKGMIDDISYSIYPPFILLILAVFFVVTEVDLGSAMIIFVTAISVMATSGIRFKSFAKMSGILLVIMAVISPILYMMRGMFLTERRIGRIQAFLHPFDYAQDYGFQVVNGYLAIGSGGLKGLGLGQSVQKLGYLPEPHTDFIMAIIAEELGVFGVIAVMGGLAFIVLKAFSISLSAKDPHARMIAAGFGSMIGFQAFVNLGGLLGLIPLTGVTLPFISYGGTSIILLSFAMGVLMNVSMFVKYEKSKR